MLAAVGCGPSAIEEFASCPVEATLEPDRGVPLDRVVATGGPFSAVYDTRVQVGGAFAEVLQVELSAECGLCESCRFNNGCETCGFCFECSALCDACVQSTTFVVPIVPPGPTTVTILNRHGSTDGIPFTILGLPVCDTDTSDTAGGCDTDTGGPTDTDTDSDTDSDTDTN